jgi:prepilin-type N-terminal cleavage/methylation domain-containing protein
MKRREAFTLIELLIVIVVIGVLAGMSFKLVRLAARKADKAATTTKLEKVSDALNEFSAEFGIYPPVNFVSYEFETTNKQHAVATIKMWENPGIGPLFNMGLVAYLEKRDNGVYHTNDPDWIPDTARGLLAKARWSVFLEGVISGGDGVGHALNIAGVESGTRYTNDVRTIFDSWGNELKYECDPPQLTYRLWSVGPDGTDNTADDMHREKWDD